MQSLNIYRLEPLWVGILLKHMAFLWPPNYTELPLQWPTPMALSRLRGRESARGGKTLLILAGNGLALRAAGSAHSFLTAVIFPPSAPEQPSACPSPPLPLPPRPSLTRQPRKEKPGVLKSERPMGKNEPLLHSKLNDQTANIQKVQQSKRKRERTNNRRLGPSEGLHLYGTVSR